jgi:hypothetical protein
MRGVSKKHCKLRFISQEENTNRAVETIINLIDDAYRKGKQITQPEIEKVLSAPPYKFSHGFVFNKLRDLQITKKIRCHQINGVNYFDFPPLIPTPFKIAIILSTLILGITTIIDVLASNIFNYQAIFLSNNQLYTDVNNGINFFAIKNGFYVISGIFMVTFLQYFLGLFKDSKNKKYLNNHM